MIAVVMAVVTLIVTVMGQLLNKSSIRLGLGVGSIAVGLGALGVTFGPIL